MIQLNLLPDVKVKFIKTQRIKRLSLMISIPVCVLLIALLSFLTYDVYVIQKNKLSSTSEAISADSEQLNKINGLGKILTIQNQLNSLDSLHSQKPVTSRLFTYIQQFTPAGISISDFKLDYATSTINVQGDASSVVAVNQFADTLKFSQYSVAGSAANKNAFKSVVLSSFTAGTKVSFTITFQFDSALFSSTSSKIALVIPSIVTTRSQTENPDALFKPQPTPATTTTTTGVTP